MGYSIHYGVSRYDEKAVPKRRKRFVIAGTILAAVILINFIFAKQLTVVRRHLLPFLEPNVQEAFGEMISEIGEGTNVSDAAVAFCREIIREASY